jgi:hypothetical protein
MAVDTSVLQVRTKEQLLEDFAGANEPELKMLNFIWSVYQAITSGDSSIAAADITDATEVGIALMTAADAAAGRTALDLGDPDPVASTDAADTGDWTADGAAVVALVNELKTKLNELIGAV